MDAGPADDAELDERLSRPIPGVIDALAATTGDIAVLGAGGKMGPSLAAMLRRAGDAGGIARRIFAISRWRDAAAAQTLARAGIEIVHADLADPAAVSSLPDAPVVFHLAGQKFGTAGAPAETWMMNTVVPSHVASRYRESRIVAFGTGNVYPLVPVSSGGARESDPLGPVGEYAASCLGRERVLEWWSARHGTPIAIVRLNYANALRYGVLTDLAQRVRDGVPVELAMGHVNVIWQGDANARAVLALAHASAPPFVINVTGPEVVRVRDAAERLGMLLGRTPVFAGMEAPDALLSDTMRARAIFPPPAVSLDTMLAWTAEWVRDQRPLLGKPTHFEARDGAF